MKRTLLVEMFTIMEDGWGGSLLRAHFAPGWVTFTRSFPQTKDGKVRNGFLTFESAEGILLQTGPTAVERIASSDIEERRPADGSLMPNGLLQSAKPQDYADLAAFLNSL